MNTVFKMTAVCILAVLIVVISSSRYNMIQVKAQGSGSQDPCSQPPSQEQERLCQEFMQKQDCMMLKKDMSGNNEAADQYKKKDCAGLLGQ